MLKCNYCGRIFKKAHQVCPGCGASSFTEYQYKHDFIIETPPEGGYKIDYDNFKKKKNLYRIFFWVGIAVIIIFLLPEIPFLFAMSFFELTFSLVFSAAFIIIPLIVAIPFILIGRNGIKDVDKQIEKLKKLSKTGILIKNLKYEVVSTGTVINGRKIYAIKVNYTTKSGVKIPLTSEEKHDGQLSREDGTVDLLIDPNDHSNYYIDFEIY